MAEENASKGDQSNDESFEEITENNDWETTTEIPTREVVTTTTDAPKRKRKPKMKRDLSAGQFYSGLVETLS